MQMDFHYYATYCAAYLAGYSHEESMTVCYSAQLVDLCSRAMLNSIGAPLSAATTQLSMEMAGARTDILGLQDITRIWASFHFLPYDLYAEVKGSKLYQDKYRLICKPNGALVPETVELAKGRSLQAVGIAMHILADTWAHSNFAGTPSLVINSTNHYFFELIDTGNGLERRPISFIHNPSSPDDFEHGVYVNTVGLNTENSIMNLGHGRAGHLPDYCFMRYQYLPAWADYEEVLKDNPSDYLHAFCQMIEAMKYLRGLRPDFAVERYDLDAIRDCEAEIRALLEKRQPDACADWKALAERLSGREIEDFDENKYIPEYKDAPRDGKDDTFLGRFILAALAQKSMVTHKIFSSGNLLTGLSVDFWEKGFRGLRDFRKLIAERGTDND